jgi:hypothetical protein
MAKKTTSLVINKVRLTRRNVIIEYHNGSESLSITSPENPLPEFKTAIAALVPLILGICHLPLEYAANLVASGLTLTEKGLVTIQGKKSFDDASGPLNIATPLRFLDTPEEEGTYSPALSDEQVEIINEVIEQAKRYILGERAQGVLFTDEDEGEDDPTGGEEPLLEESDQETEPPAADIAAVPKKPRKPREKKVVPITEG